MEYLDSLWYTVGPSLPHSDSRSRVHLSNVTTTSLSLNIPPCWHRLSSSDSELTYTFNSLSNMCPPRTWNALYTRTTHTTPPTGGRGSLSLDEVTVVSVWWSTWWADRMPNMFQRANVGRSKLLSYSHNDWSMTVKWTSMQLPIFFSVLSVCVSWHAIYSVLDWSSSCGVQQ